MPENTPQAQSGNPLAAFLPKADTATAKPKAAGIPGWLDALIGRPYPSAGAYALTVADASPEGEQGLSKTDRAVVLVAAVQADLALNESPDGYAGITVAIVAKFLALAEASAKQIMDRLVRLGALDLNDLRTTDGSKLYMIPARVADNLIG